MATSPAASGPAGAQFEGQVGASYLLCMLARSEPRGLPGTRIQSVKFQRGDEGHPLDDVIVYAQDQKGCKAILEIQVKRSITFAPTDKIFKKVVNQIADAAGKSGFWSSRIELAIATTSVSKKIHGAYQDVLSWAREIGDAATFIERINRKGSASNDMRTFVETFKNNLTEARGVTDDETVWKLLRRIQILNFDFTSKGSAYLDFALERASRVLHSEQTSQARAFWAVLIQQAIDAAKDGGERDINTLMQDLHQLQFRLAGDPNNTTVRKVLAEAADHALADIKDRVGNIFVTRHESVSLIRDALNGHERYIEIRGDAGVGKSALLKHFAKQYAEETSIIVLSPERTVPEGGTAFRASLGFNGTIKELLLDLAADGSAVLFVDNLDGFTEKKQLTVNDLIREAAKIPSFRVVATARSHFDTDNENWLNKEAIKTLGKAKPILINELNDSEVDELRSANPTLADLLSGDHKAKDVARNLYRLGRLLEIPNGQEMPRTEIDMAEQWWKTADGKLQPSAKHRNRTRLLKSLAKQALLGNGSFDVSECESDVIDSLITSGTLTEIQPDLVTFRHDVLREWAITNLLYRDNSLIDQLPLTIAPTAIFARTVELFARQTLERGPQQWKPLLDRFNGEGIHKSWQRHILLALVRSEASIEVLSSVQDVLLQDKAELLRELIRTVTAVEVAPISQIFKSAEHQLPENLFMPSSPSLYRLVNWVVQIDDDLLTPAIPEITNLYGKAILGELGRGQYTPLLLKRMYQWLKEIEASKSTRSWNTEQPFNGNLIGADLNALTNELRSYFLAFCHRTPDFAKDYMDELLKRSQNDLIVESVIMSSGALSNVAPEGLATLTANALIALPKDDEFYSSYRQEPFSLFDKKFLHEAPTKGPFLQLLQNAPKQGLSLIHKLISHALDFDSRGKHHGSNAIVIEFPEGKREFPWRETYLWSRQHSNGHYCVTTALMALEAWAHNRVENGEDISVILNDIYGPETVPACYLLLAVDLIVSHWPTSRDMAVPYICSPELLSIDRMRIARERANTHAFFNANTSDADRESLKKLKNYASRRYALEELLAYYALFPPLTQKETIKKALQEASMHLPAYTQDADFTDPAFMAFHALNSLDESNYTEETVKLSDGTSQKARKYIPPANEQEHCVRLEDAHKEQTRDAFLPASISIGIEDSSRITDEFIDNAILWAKEKIESGSTQSSENADLIYPAIIGSAFIAMRDGNDDCRQNNKTWAKELFIEVLQSNRENPKRYVGQLPYNPPALAFAGLAYSLQKDTMNEDTQTLLECAAWQSSAVVSGFDTTISIIEEADARLPRSILRCAFTACTRPHLSWENRDEESEKQALHKNKIQSAIDAEMSWLHCNGDEPSWPSFALDKPRIRRGIRIPKAGEKTTSFDAPADMEIRTEFTEHQTASAWLKATGQLTEKTKQPWVINLLAKYKSWTVSMNGAGQKDNVQLENKPNEWNIVYYDLLSQSIGYDDLSDIKDTIQSFVNNIPDEAFLDVTNIFLRGIDIAFIQEKLTTAQATLIRGILFERLSECNIWHSLKTSSSFSVDTVSAGAIASFFFNRYMGFASLPSKSYLSEKDIDKIEPLLPLIETMAQDAPCPFVAVLLLDLLEVSPRKEHLNILLTGTNAWLRHMPSNTEFWINHGIGHRFCKLVEAIHLKTPDSLAPDSEARQVLDTLLAELTKLGVPEASQLEQKLGTSHP